MQTEIRNRIVAYPLDHDDKYNAVKPENGLHVLAGECRATVPLNGCRYPAEFHGGLAAN